MSSLTQDDIQFLRQLAHRVRTQDTAYSARPVIFQVMEQKRRTPIDPDYADGMCLVLGGGGEEFFEDTLEQAKEFLGESEMTPAEADALGNVSTLEALKDWCDDVGFDDYHYTGYEDYERYSGAFLTREACERHIAVNRHHYTDPQVFARSVWRNPELERLLTILEKFAEAVPHD